MTKRSGSWFTDDAPGFADGLSPRSPIRPTPALHAAVADVTLPGTAPATMQGNQQHRGQEDSSARFWTGGAITHRLPDPQAADVSRGKDLSNRGKCSPNRPYPQGMCSPLQLDSGSTTSN